MSRLRLVSRFLAAASLLAIAMAGPAAAARSCDAPDELDGVVTALPHVAAVLKPGATLDVLTVGSATVFSPMASLQPGPVANDAGAGARPAQPLTPDDAAFPQQMAKLLRAKTPGLTVNVTVKGGRGLTAAEMLELLRTELALKRYNLVIWQTGTVEAVRNIPVGQFYQTLLDGSASTSEAGADLILVDPQFSRFLRTNADLDPYAQAMQQIAAQPDVLLFHRYDLMRYWANEGNIDLERTPKAQRLDTVEALHACLGAHLARMVAEGARTPS